MFPLFAIGVIDTNGKFAALVVDIFDTGGKFAAGIVDTGGKFATDINKTSETDYKIETQRNNRISPKNGPIKIIVFTKP
jgi:hypothetical protein